MRQQETIRIETTNGELTRYIYIRILFITKE